MVGCFTSRIVIAKEKISDVKDMTPGEQSEVTVTLQRKGKGLAGEEADGN